MSVIKKGASYFKEKNELINVFRATKNRRNDIKRKRIRYFLVCAI
jgi:hypothetical protein